MSPLQPALTAMTLMALMLLPVSAAPVRLCFSNMEDGDRVEITFKSKGCFHDFTDYYEVSRRDGKCAFRQYAIKWTKTAPATIAEKKLVGEIALTQTEVTQLDALLHYYRGKKQGFCTTQVSLLVEYFERDKQVGAEQLFDESGAIELEKRKDVIQFFQLIARFKK